MINLCYVDLSVCVSPLSLIENCLFVQILMRGVMKVSNEPFCSQFTSDFCNIFLFLTKLILTECGILKIINNKIMNKID